LIPTENVLTNYNNPCPKLCLFFDKCKHVHGFQFNGSELKTTQQRFSYKINVVSI